MNRLRFATPILIAALAVPSFAEESPDRGRKLLPKLFESAAVDAAKATLRIQVNGKDVALGTAMSKAGHILTKGSELIGKGGKLKDNSSILLADGSAFDFEVLGYEPKTDLMLLKCDIDGLAPVSFAPSKAIEPGNWVAATGYKTKAGEGDSVEPISAGVVSTLARPLYFQEAVIENANRGYLGIIFEMSRDATNTRVDEVKNDGARRAGLKKGDAIIGVNEKAIGSREDLFQFMNETRPGESLQVKIRRKPTSGDDEELTFKFNTINAGVMDRGIYQNTLSGTLSDRRGGFPKVIQHDVLLSPKQCGGPLVDLDGKVLGINIARAGRVESWALPAEVIEAAYKDLKDGKHPYPKPKDAAKAEVKASEGK